MISKANSCNLQIVTQCSSKRIWATGNLNCKFLRIIKRCDSTMITIPILHPKRSFVLQSSLLLSLWKFAYCWSIQPASRRRYAIFMSITSMTGNSHRNKSPNAQYFTYKMSRQWILALGIVIGGQLLLVIVFTDFPGYFRKSSTDTTSDASTNITTQAALSRFQRMRFETQESVSKYRESRLWTRNWTLTREDMLNEGPEARISKDRHDLLLLVRKLVLFSVREVNKRLSEREATECTNWWVNPLSVTKVQERSVFNSGKLYKIHFEAQPGGIPFEATVIVVEGTSGSGSDLIFVNGRRLDKLRRKCGSVRQSLRPICLCPEEMQKAEERTARLRFEWKKTDPELFSWPPNAPMFVPDYISFRNENLYTKTPSNRTEFCGPDVKIIVFISSAPTHTARRNTIRKTFGNPKYLHPLLGARLLFLFGKITNRTLQTEIDAEFEAHEDIVQADFADSYHNLSLSHLSMYNWVVKRCHNGHQMPKWVLKADDDFILNVPLALRAAEANPDTEMLGIHFCGTKAIRDTRYMQKYYVPRYMYAPNWYAGYVSGVAYLVQTSIFRSILRASRHTPLTHMDDCYVMGLLTKEAQIRPRHSTLFTYKRIDPDICNTKLMVSSHVLNCADLEVQWTVLNTPLLNADDCFLDESVLEVKALIPAVNRVCLFE